MTSSDQLRHNVNARTTYLTIYNLILAFLWSSVFASTVRSLPHGRLSVFSNVSRNAGWTQTLTLVEIVHSAIGLIPSPVGTTFTQVVTRVIQVWLIWHGFSGTTAASLAFPALVLAWSTADTVRYVYLAANLYGMAPQWLVWLRYSLFIPLYPIGIASEWWLMYKAVKPAGDIHPVLPYIFYFLLALYVPGTYKMFTYMVRQRRKALAKTSKDSKRRA